MDRDNDVIFLDTETTARFASKAKLAEIFLMRCRGPRLRPISYLELMCNPGIPMPAGAFEVNGLKDEWLEYADNEKDVLKDAQCFIRDTDTLVGHNIKRYDIIIMERYGIKYDNKIVDTMQMAAEAGFPKGSRSQDFLYKHFFPDRPQESHRAIVDVKKLRMNYLKLRDMISAGKLF